MTRSLLLVTLIATTVPTLAAFGEQDVVTPRIQAAKETYARECETLRGNLLKSLSKAADTARKAGNKSLLDKITAETDAFEAKSTLPTVLSTKDYQRKLRKAREVMEGVYLQGVKSFTKAGLMTEADTLDKELREFQLQAKVFRGKHYAVIKAQVTWQDSKAICERMGGHLGIIRSEDESKYLIELTKAEGAKRIFIGATDERKEGQWLWIDGTPVTYSQWDRAAAQPNNNNGRGQVENFAAIMNDHGGAWWDVPPRGEGLDSFLCQWD